MKAAGAMLLVLNCALSGCVKSGSLSEGRHSWTRAGVLRIALAEEPKTLNPLLFGTTGEGFVERLMFEPLLSADPRGNLVPMLAAAVPTQTNRGVSADGLTITYHLRRDARWSDGVPVTANDVKFSRNAIENPNNNVVSRHGYDDVAAIDTPDAKTVTVHLKKRFRPSSTPFSPKATSRTTWCRRTFWRAIRISTGFRSTPRPR
ncbi:MAG TPA: ABC transporter substrate-binding protein [Candidatus Cybelea sp.]|jgi:peptide/nickel transport system substrate-binding protein